MSPKNRIAQVFKFALVFLLTIGALFSNLGAENLPVARAQQADPASVSAVPTGWKSYLDPQYGFQFDYPGDWGVKVAFQNFGQPDDIIKQRVTLSNDQFAFINIDVWENTAGLLPSEWIDKYQRGLLASSVAIPSVSNMEVGGVDGFFIVQPPNPEQQIIGHVITILQKNGLTYRIEYLAQDGGAAQDLYVAVLSTFKFSSVSIALPKLPPAPFFGIQSQPQDTDCCGLHDTQYNPYPCSGGNCTWYAAYKRDDLPYQNQSWGNAKDWITNARSVGYPTGTTPQVGAIVVFQPGVQGADSTYGHVAYVEQVYSSTSFRVTSQSWLGNCVLSNYTAYTGTGVDFIYHPTSDNASFVTDVTIPDGTTLNPGQTFTKTWRMKNTGTTTWGSGYSWAFTSGDQMSAPSSVSVSSTSPNNTADISVNMVAPTTAGSYTGNWRMKNSQGQLFGDEVWVKINVSSSSGGTCTNGAQSGALQSGYQYCADEGGTCNLSAQASVAYGANNCYFYQTFSSSVSCSNSTFNDPIIGSGKKCYYKSTGSAPSTPSSPNPSDNQTLSRANDTYLYWSTTGTSCDVHIWGGNIDINPSGGSCSSLHLGNQYGGAYQWQVTAHNAYGTTTGPTWHFNVQPYAPSNLNASATSQTQINLSWTKSTDEPSNVDSYKVYYSNGTFINTVPSGSTGYQVDGLTANTNYSFYVKAVRQGVESVASNTASATTQSSITPIDVLFNGGFEDGSNAIPDGWRTDAWTMPYSTFTWDSSVAHSGVKSVKIASGTANDARWIQTIYVQPNSNYQLSGWIKTQDVAHSLDSVDAGATLSVMGGFEHTQGLFGTNDWTYVSLPFKTGSRTQIDVGGRIGMYSGTTTGTAWFDDMKLELLSVPTCFTLSTGIAPASTGNISVSPSPNCSNGTQYAIGTTVKLTASPASGYVFGSWSGDATGVSNPTTLAITANKSVTANFQPPLPTLTSPLNGALVSVFRPTFKWQAVSGAAKYRIAVSRYASLASPLVNATLTTLSYTPTINLPTKTKLYWSVRTVSAGGALGSWASLYSFTIGLPAPTLVSPANLSTGIALRPTFHWYPVSGATSYTLQVSTSSTFSTFLVNIKIASTSYIPTKNLPSNRVLYWRVLAAGAVGSSNWSSIFMFTTTP